MAAWLMYLKPFAEDAPLFTFLVAAFAVIVAIWSLCAQKQIARGRAAIDFFLKTDMDTSMLKAWNNYQAGLVELHKKPRTMIMDDADKYYRAIRTYLDINELMAIAIDKRVFSDDVCYTFWCNTLKSVNEDAIEIIKQAQGLKYGDKRYTAMQALHERWKKKK